ncbi:MAG: isoprenylcysteine carboxylmethyltransferase family protein [Betaproteobacteria bacterium]
MTLIYRYLFPALWLSWAIYWSLTSRNVKTTARQESLPSHLSHIVPLVLAIVLLWLPSLPVPWLGDRFIPPSAWAFWIGALLTTAGILFTVWARVHLGRNWSAIVTIKQGHEFISSGPYAIVRHPIYSGLLLAFVGSALARGEWRGVVAVLIALAAFWRKLRIEERWMREQFGEQYVAYCRRVAALVPFII